MTYEQKAFIKQFRMRVEYIFMLALCDKPDKTMIME